MKLARRRSQAKNLGLPTISHKRDGTKPPQSPTGRSLVVESDDNNTNHAKINCAYCNALHYSTLCEKVKDPEARRKILGQSGRCFICLRKGHQAKSCTSTRGCRHCQKRHHQSICPQLQREPPQHPQEPPPAPRTSKDSPETVKPTITATRLSKGTVLLQTARAIATSNGKSTSVRVLFDAGSQRSYVSNVVLQRLSRLHSLQGPSSPMRRLCSKRSRVNRLCQSFFTRLIRLNILSNFASVVGVISSNSIICNTFSRDFQSGKVNTVARHQDILWNNNQISKC